MSDLKRYTIDEKITVGQNIEITGVQQNHIVNVMRHKAGDKIILLCGDGFDYTCDIIQTTKKTAAVHIISKQENMHKCKSKLTVICGLIKGEGNDCQAVKCSELGVYEFVPFVSGNCVIDKSSGKAERLKRIAAESSKQCKRAVPMAVTDTLDFTEVLNYIKDFDIKIIAYENENKNSLKNALQKFGKADKIALIIGSEGGFTEKEIDLAKSYGCVSVTLGKTILKADTAAIAAASAVLFGLGEWDV